ncbi:unnamed protein product [Owenia fusiformis]|uniref:Uncharacterized protein n=1 Tax=Owenia fusiformis TaxID=6347 RepID=A0A8S4NHL2_OWEFU|nr:unnamed protein product [Owenia fusiformis]
MLSPLLYPYRRIPQTLTQLIKRNIYFNDNSGRTNILDESKWVKVVSMQSQQKRWRGRNTGRYSGKRERKDGFRKNECKELVSQQRKDFKRNFGLRRAVEYVKIWKGDFGRKMLGMKEYIQKTSEKEFGKQTIIKHYNKLKFKEYGRNMFVDYMNIRKEEFARKAEFIKYMNKHNKHFWKKYLEMKDFIESVKYVSRYRKDFWNKHKENPKENSKESVGYMNMDNYKDKEIVDYVNKSKRPGEFLLYIKKNKKEEIKDFIKSSFKFGVKYGHRIYFVYKTLSGDHFIQLDQDQPDYLEKKSTNTSEEEKLTHFLDDNINEEQQKSGEEKAMGETENGNKKTGMTKQIVETSIRVGIIVTTGYWF